METHPGQQLGKYRILEAIGQGAVGTVYKGYDAERDGPVAIKVLTPPFAADPDFIQLFLHQARATAQLKHPHIVVVLDAGQQNGQTWMGMEYLDGIALRELIRLQGPLLANEAQAIVRNVASALDYIHGRGLLHGDVRAGNVMICPPGRILLTELGVVRTRWEGQIASSAVSAAIAPEQVTGGELGPWTDLYALGILAYEMLGGRPPYASDTTAGLLSQVVHEPAPSLQALRPDLPVAAVQVLDKALAKAPPARYRSGAEFADALEAALLAPVGASVPGRAAPPPPPPVVEEPPPPIRRPPSPPADRLIRHRIPPAQPLLRQGQKKTPRPRAPQWPWLLLGFEALLLLAGIALIVLLVTGVL